MSCAWFYGKQIIELIQNWNDYISTHIVYITNKRKIGESIINMQTATLMELVAISAFGTVHYK